MSPHNTSAGSGQTAERTPIVLVPGAWTTADSFDDVRDAFEHHGHPTRVLDLPARSRRLPQLDGGGLVAIDRELDEALDEYDQSPILAGHSLGGLMALRAARRHEVRALVLLMPAPPMGMLPTILGDAVKHPYSSFRTLGAAFSVTLGTRLGFKPPDGLYSSAATPETLARGAAYRVDESWSVLAALAVGSREPVEPAGVPTLVVAGHQDRFTPTRVLRPVADALNAELQEFDVAHAFNEEPTYSVVTDAVLDFLARSVA